MLNIQENINLAPLTTLKIGGKARFLVKAESETQVGDAVEFAAENDFEIFILGGGSNVLIADRGFDGLVLQIALKGISISEGLNGKVSVTAQAGEDWNEFVAFCVEKNLAGIECLSGIPGLVGGTPVQNVGAYGQEVSETISKVRVFDRKSGQILELTNADCKFAYRTSIFNTSDKNRFIVLSVSYELFENGSPKIVYKDLIEFFGEKSPTLKSVREAVLQIRRAKSMVIDEADENSRSAGSFFKNPLVSKDEFVQIEKAFGASIPNFSVDANSVKIPAAWLIEQSGFYKGYEKSGVGISSKHTLAIINLGSASANDVLSLKKEIQAGVKKTFEIELTPEPIMVGF